MNKLSISVNIPAIGARHEFLIPGNMQIKKVIGLMVKILVSEYGVSTDTSDLMLFDNSDVKVLDMEYTLLQLGVSDGDTFTLI